MHIATKTSSGGSIRPAKLVVRNKMTRSLRRPAVVPAIAHQRASISPRLRLRECRIFARLVVVVAVMMMMLHRWRRRHSKHIPPRTISALWDWVPERHPGTRRCLRSPRLRTCKRSSDSSASFHLFFSLLVSLLMTKHLLHSRFIFFIFIFGSHLALPICSCQATPHFNLGVHIGCPFSPDTAHSLSSSRLDLFHARSIRHVSIFVFFFLSFTSIPRLIFFIEFCDDIFGSILFIHRALQ